jgi:trk system potassium uptake protein TrkH
VADFHHQVTPHAGRTGNIGLGLGGLANGSLVAGCPGYVKWGLCFVMIAGRLELWTAFVIFTPQYWRR